MNNILGMTWSIILKLFQDCNLFVENAIICSLIILYRNVTFGDCLHIKKRSDSRGFKFEKIFETFR